MSDEHTKISHSKRIHQKSNYIRKQTKIANLNGIQIRPGEEHRLLDHAALNCGNPGCVMCANPRRIWKKKTIKEKSFEQTLNWME